MSDISDFSESENFDEDEKRRNFFSIMSRNSTESKKKSMEKTEHISKNNSIKNIEENDENGKLSNQQAGTIKALPSVTKKNISRDYNSINAQDSKIFRHHLFSSSKAKIDAKHNTTPNGRVADCVISPPEFFLSHIYHDNKVFTKKYGHSIVEYDNKFFIYGGINTTNEYLNEFLTFTYGSNIFTSKKLSVNPGKRAYASMTLAHNVKNNPCLLLFGGLCGPNTLAKDCYTYDFMEDTWSIYSFKLNLAPEIRYGHAYTFCPDTYTTVVWGGINKNNELLKTCHKFIKGEWSEIKHTGTGPSGRAFSSIVWLDRTTKENINFSFLYLFGGDLSNKGTPTDELWIYNFTKESWALINNSAGEAPCPRWKHGAVIFDKKMWISGGLFSGWFSNYTVPDLYVYDIPSNCWFNCQMSSKEIHCCYDYGTLNLHSLTKAFFLFGGKNANNEPTSYVCRFAPLCTIVSIMTMRNEINRLSNYLLDVKNESEDTANNVSEIQKIIHSFSLDIKDFKIIFEALTNSIKIIKENIDDINKELSFLKKQNLNHENVENTIQTNIDNLTKQIDTLNEFRNELINADN